jgi:prephenate dehydrogenase
MDLQYLSDTQGKHTAIVIPIDQWNDMTAKHQDLKALETPKNDASRFKGLLTNEEAEKYHSYIKQARSEWERDI